jgi:hypothetical protein
MSGYEPQEQTEAREREKINLRGIVNQMTGDEAIVLLRWMAENKPDALRTAFRGGPDVRVHALYIEAGRPHS